MPTVLLSMKCLIKGIKLILVSEEALIRMLTLYIVLNKFKKNYLI